MPGKSELDRIEAEGRALEAGEAGAPGAGALPDLDASAPAGPTDAEQAAMWAALPKTFGSILSMALPELAPVYSDAACGAWGQAMLPVAKKYGWNSLDSLPELTLALVSLPFIIPTVIAIKRKRAAPAAPSDTEPKPGEAAPAAAPDGAPVGSVNAGVV